MAPTYLFVLRRNHLGEPRPIRLVRNIGESLKLLEESPCNPSYKDCYPAIVGAGESAGRRFEISARRRRSVEKHVELLTGVKYRGITSRGVSILDKDGRERFLEADTVVIAAGFKPNDGLKAVMNGHAPELYAIGDCVEPRSIMSAIEEGWRVGASI